MDDKVKLVTLAIHSLEKAQALQQELEANGIQSIIQHVGDSIVTRNVRVRIKETDLDKATAIVEEINQSQVAEEALCKACNKGELLVPIDFSDFSLRICEVAFHLAQAYRTNVVLFHSFIDPTPHINLIEEMLTREKGKRDTALQDKLNEVREKQERLDAQLKAAIERKELPDINYRFVNKTGIPEEAILKYSRANEPRLIVMGSRSKAEIDSEEIGSITGEVMERSRIPVFVLPKNSSFKNFSELKNLVYATRFEDDDLMAFDNLMSLLKPFRFKVHFLHLAKGKKNEESDNQLWNEIKLRGIQEYFKKNYPEQDITLSLLNGDDTLPAIDKYVREENIDVVSLTTHERSIFVRLFNPSTAKTMLDNTQTPLLVFHV